MRYGSSISHAGVLPCGQNGPLEEYRQTNKWFLKVKSEKRMLNVVEF